MNDKVKRDGTDISDYLFNPEKKRVDRTYFYWHVGYLQAVRYCDWKLNLLGEFSEKERQNILNSTYKHTVFPDHAELYNLRSDPGETTDVADKFPGMVAQIRKMAERSRKIKNDRTWQPADRRVEVGRALLHAAEKQYLFNPWV